MNLDIVLKVGGIGVIVGLIVMILKSTEKGSDYAPYVTIAGIIIALTFVIEEINRLLNLVQSVFKLY